MANETGEVDFPDLTERILARFTSADAGWSSELVRLPCAARKSLLAELCKSMTDAEADEVVRLLDHAFGMAVQIEEFGCRFRKATAGSAKGRKRSRKLGVRLRRDITGVLARLEKGDTTPVEICSSILSEPTLERLVTPLLEQCLRGGIDDPLRNAPESAAEHLPDVLDQLHAAIHAGVTSGPVDPVQDFLASAVVTAMERATGNIPGRTWIEERVEETGVGLEVCRILAAALNDALPAECRSKRSADMAKAFRRAIKAARSGA